MKEQDINVTDVTIAHDRRKNAWEYEPSKTSLYRKE